MPLRDLIQLTCTDRGQHPAVEIARLEWRPDRDDGDQDVHIWAPGDPDGMTVDLITENVRGHREGGTTSHVVRTAATLDDRPDGGLILQAHCVRCRRQWRRRESWIDALRASPSGTLDLSFID